ncbi:MAG: sugar transferase [Clostridia bacterium]|nr:sugar transferase [Clostridia bacterium]
MIFKKWDAIPENLKNEETKKYYDILSRKKIQLCLKRIFDFMISFIMLILLSPFLLIMAIIIKIDSKGPVFYRQERITQYGRMFKIFKFRTMVQNADKIGSLVTLGEDPRITRVGKKIRKYRIDEIPQLINILMGDMSFVGTRPEVKKYTDLYTDEMKATLLMPAGVTSRASIEYKDEDQMINTYLNKGEKVDDIYVNRVLPEKMKWNLKYIEEFNILKDIKIMLDTVIGVMK